MALVQRISAFSNASQPTLTFIYLGFYRDGGGGGDGGEKVAERSVEKARSEKWENPEKKSNDTFR